MSAEYGEVFQRFGIEPQESIYAYSPVFRGEVGGRQVAVKRTHSGAAMVRWLHSLAARGVPVVTPVAGPVRIGAWDWVAYPWIDGRLYNGTPADAAAAGALLGRIHTIPPHGAGVEEGAGEGDGAGVEEEAGEGDGAGVEEEAREGDGAGVEEGAGEGDGAGVGKAAGDRDGDPGGSGLPAFSWPDHDQASIDEDVMGLSTVLRAHRPDLHAEVMGRLEPLLRSFMTTTLPAIRDADLPVVDACLDFKAVNLVYPQDTPTAPRGPVLVDPDNGERVPRLLDLALAVLLFHNDLPGEPAGLFDAEQWQAFREAYLAEVELTEEERRLWPTALQYMLLEWGVWTVINGDEAGDWVHPRHAEFLTALVTVDVTGFPLNGEMA
ncbi:phosphotransferase [Nonomuraea sp. NPDC050328]|uniref:phosphotransferase n=1 Tax=Nonomuraea sp. NPDC050328 TaxID=3364361 RepID=UPI0037880E1B